MANLYNAKRLEVVKDIYGESCYVAEMIAAPKHGISICYGRPIDSLVGGRRVILTPELADFVKSTLHLKEKEFDLPIVQGTLNILRFTLQNNPYKTYQKWLENPERPSYVTFNQNKPERVYDDYGQKHILYTAEMTTLSIPLLKGVAEHSYKGHIGIRPKLIITPELVKLFTDYRMKPEVLLDLIPMLKSTLQRVRRQLGHNLAADKNRWFAERFDDLIALTPTEFKKKHKYDKSYKDISSISVPVKAILAMRESGLEKGAEFLALLESNWLIANKTTKKEMNKYCNNTHQSEKFRRAYQILKLAHRI